MLFIMEITIKHAITKHKEGKLIEAENLYRSILKIQPEHVGANNNLGVLLQALDKFEEAEASYKKAIEFKPDYAAAHNNLGAVLKALGRPAEAEASYKKAIEFKPDYVEAYFNLGNTFQDLGRPAEAEASYKKAIGLKPDYAEAHNNLARSLYVLGKCEEATTNFKKAIELKPDYAEAHNNLASSLYVLGKCEEATTNFKKAIELKPDYAEAHNNLGAVQRDLGRLAEAQASYNKAIKLKPNFMEGLINRGQLLFDKGEFELSLRDFDTCNTEDSRLRGLVSLYALGRIEEIYERIKTQYHLDSKSIGVAAFSSFITAKEKRKTENKFCQNPIDFIDFRNLSSNLINPKPFINEVIEELNNMNTKWEPFGKTTHNGFQSRSVLFTNPSEKLSILKSIIMEEINSYLLKFNDKVCDYIKEWPHKNDLIAWHVILKQQGYQDAHIHPSGWLSGVIYLKVVPPFENNEGAIEFSLNGKHYSDPNSPKVIHQPKVGDIILFPSSLHHRTIPFTTETDRISISFDLASLA
jgi:Flp pilus assembly protein TadD